MRCVVDQAEWRYRPRRQPEMRHQAFGRREAQFAVADLVRDLPEIRLLRMLDDDEIVPGALLITEEEVLAVRGVDVGPVLNRLFDGRNRRMLLAGVRNAELGKASGDGRLLLRHVVSA